MIELPKLILASGSPRRAEILDSVGWPFEKHTADIDESERDGESPEDYVIRLAREKAEAVAANYPGQLVLGADTTVVIDGQILGKPVDMDDARRMIRMLAGVSHDVLTAGRRLVDPPAIAGFVMSQVICPVGALPRRKHPPAGHTRYCPAVGAFVSMSVWSV